jgi:hypothetical protein
VEDEDHEFPRQTFANHLFSYEPGWRQTVDYSTDDERMPASLRDFFRHEGLSVTLIAPLLISDKNSRLDHAVHTREQRLR